MPPNYKIPKGNCLECKKELWDDLTTSPVTPNTGIVCVFCGHIMELDEKLNFTEPKETSEHIRTLSKLIKFITAKKANPFNGDEDKYSIKSIFFNMQ